MHSQTFQGKEGSVVEAEGKPPTFKAGEGRPGIWQKDVVDGQVVATLVPSAGSVASLLRASEGTITADPRVEVCRTENQPPPVPDRTEPEPEPAGSAIGDGNRRLDVAGIATGERPRLQK